MKTKLLSIAAFFAMISFSQAQVIYFNNFSVQAGITVIDADGDANNWSLITGNATTNSWGLSGNFVGSRSWNPSNATPAGALTPNNFLITPSFTIPNSFEPTLMTFKLGSNDPQAFLERIAIYLAPTTATTASQYSALTPVYEYVLQQSDCLSAQTRTVDISAFVGQTVKIVIRHYNSVDQDLMYLDDLKVSQGTLGTQDFAASEFAVYPNPASNVIYVSSERNFAINDISIVDLNGRMVQDASFAGLTKAELNISGLSAGIYIVKISSELGSVTKKIVKK